MACTDIQRTARAGRSLPSTALSARPAVTAVEESFLIGAAGHGSLRAGLTCPQTGASTSTCRQFSTMARGGNGATKSGSKVAAASSFPPSRPLLCISTARIRTQKTATKPLRCGAPSNAATSAATLLTRTPSSACARAATPCTPCPLPMQTSRTVPVTGNFIRCTSNIWTSFRCLPLRARCTTACWTPRATRSTAPGAAAAPGVHLAAASAASAELRLSTLELALNCLQPLPDVLNEEEGEAGGSGGRTRWRGRKAVDVYYVLFHPGHGEHSEFKSEELCC